MYGSILAGIGFVSALVSLFIVTTWIRLWLAHDRFEFDQPADNSQSHQGHRMAYSSVRQGNRQAFYGKRVSLAPANHNHSSGFDGGSDACCDSQRRFSISDGDLEKLPE